MSNTKKEKKPFFYGWVIVIACMLIQAVPYGLATNVHPQFISFVTKGEGFTITQFSMLFTIGTIVSALASPFIGKILSNPKVNLKLVFLIGSIISGGSFALFSVAGDKIWVYYLLACFLQVGISTISAIGVPTLVNSWFKENKGFAMGLAFAGGGIGNMILQPTAAALLSNQNFGYAKTYLIFGITALVVSIPVSLFLVRFPRNEAELAANVSKKNAEENKTVSQWGYTFKEATSMKFFWILALGFVFVGFYVSGMGIQFSSYFYSEGFSPVLVGTVGSLFAIFSIFGNLGGGFLFDKLGTTKSLVFAGALVVLCGVSLIFAPQIPALAYVFAASLGISMFSYVIGPSYLTGALFGDRDFGSILAIVQVFFAVGYAFGTVAFGLVVDNFGYKTGWLACIGYAFIAYTFLLTACTGVQKYNKENNVKETKKIA